MCPPGHALGKTSCPASESIFSGTYNLSLGAYFQQDKDQEGIFSIEGKKACRLIAEVLNHKEGRRTLQNAASVEF